MNRNEKIGWAVVAMVVAALMALMFLGCDLARDALGVDKSPTAPPDPIIADFRWDQRGTSLTVDFRNVSLGPFKGTDWSFGDGQVDQGTRVENTYLDYGEYQVTMRTCPGSDFTDPGCDDRVKTIRVEH